LIGYTVPKSAFKNAGRIKVLLVVISTTTAKTGTVKISLKAYVNFVREQEFPTTLLQYFSKEMQKKCK